MLQTPRLEQCPATGNSLRLDPCKRSVRGSGSFEEGQWQVYHSARFAIRFEMASWLLCAYCGKSAADTSDHVFPRGLYGDEIIGQQHLITVPSCYTCNNQWAKGEATFRNVIAVSGEPNSAVSNLWSGKIRRGFTYRDGRSRAHEVARHLRAVPELPGRYMIFPAEVPGVLPIVRKITRGLCHYHGLLSPVADEQVWSDVKRFEIPPEFLQAMRTADANPQVARYRYCRVGEFGMHSAWLIEFFGRTEFLSIVYDTTAARQEAQQAGNKKVAATCVPGARPGVGIGARESGWGQLLQVRYIKVRYITPFPVKQTHGESENTVP